MEFLSLREIDRFDKYIEALNQYKNDYFICAAARDTLHGMDEDSIDAAKKLGMNCICADWVGYVFIMEQGLVHLDKVSPKNLSVTEYIELDIFKVQIISKSWRAGNKARIVFDDYDVAVNRRGLNIAVYDVAQGKLVDSVCFDFFDKNIRCYRVDECQENFLGIMKKNIINGQVFLNPDEKLDSIIEKYKINEYYPRYFNVKKTQKAIFDLAESWGRNESIACILIGDDLRKIELDKVMFSKNLSFMRNNQIDYITCKLEKRIYDPTLYTYDKNAFDSKELEFRAWESYSRVYIISNSGDNFVGFWLRQHKISYTRIYDYFASIGIVNTGNGEYYEFIDDKRENRFYYNDTTEDPVRWEIYEQSQNYNMCKEANIRLMIAKRIFFLLIYAKNFILAKEWIEKIISLEEDSKYENAWNEIQTLLREVAEHIKERKQRDVLLIWVDDTSRYDVKKYMPFVSSMQEKGIWFDDMITLTGYTRETLRSIFTGKKLIDDQTNNIQEINIENSKVIQHLEKNKYRIYITGGLQKIFQNRYSSQKCFRISTISYSLWEMICQLSMYINPCFGVCHVMETHAPHCYIGLTDENVSRSNLRHIEAAIEADQQIEFYLNMLGGNSTSILFSDHGASYFAHRQNVFLAIYGDTYHPRKIHGICTTNEFYEILKNVVEGKEIDENELRHDFVEIQGVPLLRGGKFLNPAGIMREAIPAFFPPFRGYRGIVTEEYVYVHFSGGREWLSRRNKIQPWPSWYVRPDDICDGNLLPEMRRKAGIDYGNEPPEYGPRSEYYISLQETYEKNYHYNELKVHLINHLVARIPNGMTALYLGDNASREAYLSLSLDNRKKIICVIQKNANCPCSGLGLPVIPLEKATEYGVRQMLMTARCMPKELADFLKHQGQDIHVFGIYGWFEVNGYHTKHNFYDFAIQSMDAPLPSPLAIPDFLYHVAPECPCEVSVVVMVEDESTLLSRLHDILRQTSMGVRIHCLDLTGKAAELVKAYQKVASSIEVISVAEYSSLPSKLNELISSVNSKYLFFLDADESLHVWGLFYLHEIAEQTEADVVAAGAIPKADKNVEPILADVAEGTFELKKEARILPATFKERYGELDEIEIPDFAGNKLYRVDFLRKYGIRFQDIKSGWKDIFCFQTIFGAPKYVKAVSPVCISSGNTAGFVSEDNSAEYAKKLVESMFAYQQAIEAMLKQWGGFGNNPSLCDAFRERAMTIFDQQYFSGIALDDEIRKAVSQTVQEELQKNPSIGMWWIKHLFMRSSFPQNV